MIEDILGKPLRTWIELFPLIEKAIKYEPVFWFNEKLGEASKILPTLPMTLKDMEEAEKRWQRFASLIAELFPETQNNPFGAGIIESDLVEIPKMKESIESRYGQSAKGKMYLKCDSALPVAGSIKARGGIYEVLKHAETLALEKGMLKESDDYAVLAEPSFKAFFGQYALAVGSTGNLGLSIGIMGAALGFRVTVHMSADAKEWKKKLLRSRGVEVVEYASDYSKAVEEGRKQSEADPMSYFIDDEHSKNLFMGYSVAAFRLKRQLEDKGIQVDADHPLFVYLPCGVGGAPGGICFGLKQIYGDHVHCFFVEPTHAPCMLLGLMTGENERVSVQDFGLDNLTDADGLAVGRPSGLVGDIVERLLSGVYTIEDDELYRLLVLLKDSEGVKIEPSAASSLVGALMLEQSAEGERYMDNMPMDNATHIAWATGGLFVPEDMMEGFYERGRRLLK